MLWAGTSRSAQSNQNWLALSPSVAHSCFDLIGLPYRLGANGTDGYIDCIHLVTVALDCMRIKHPPITEDMYDASSRQIARWLITWGNRITQPSYDGDVLVLPSQQRAFGVVWNGGILYINELSRTVQWTPPSSFTGCPCFRTKGS